MTVNMFCGGNSVQIKNLRALGGRIPPLPLLRHATKNFLAIKASLSRPSLLYLVVRIKISWASSYLLL